MSNNAVGMGVQDSAEREKFENEVKRIAETYPQLSTTDKATVARQVETILTRLESEPKSLAWKLRARVGDRIKWYKDVDEVK